MFSQSTSNNDFGLISLHPVLLPDQSTPGAARRAKRPRLEAPTPARDTSSTAAAAVATAAESRRGSGEAATPEAYASEGCAMPALDGPRRGGATKPKPGAAENEETQSSPGCRQPWPTTAAETARAKAAKKTRSRQLLRGEATSLQFGRLIRLGPARRQPEFLQIPANTALAVGSGTKKQRRESGNSA
mmetsp:Transcript_72635/g.147408  ORF Transcript_72635/g.147408 Transcript_72635/m.147408 type:complete len:188 (+) Transcript_72635:118-681(+)